MAKRKYQFSEDYPIIVKNQDFMFLWCCDCGLRHVNFYEIERGKSPCEDKVNIFMLRDDAGTDYRKDYERLKKKRKK